MPRHDHVCAPNPGSPSGTSRNSRTSSACPPSTGDSWGTAGWLGEVGYEARRQVRTLFAAVSGPASARGRAVAARTGAQPRGALVPRSRGSKLAATGPGLQAPSALRAARARDFLGAGKSPEFSPNPILVTFRTLQQCRYSAAAQLSESWREHFRTTFLAPAKASWLETSSLGGKKARKISDLPVPSGCAAWNLGCARDSVARPGHQLGDLWLFPEGRKDAPLSNKRLATWAPWGRSGEPFPVGPCAPGPPRLAHRTRSLPAFPLTCLSPPCFPPAGPAPTPDSPV